MRPQLPSPGRMAIPPGSSLRALRVGSGRGPISRTAFRCAASGRMERATGSINPTGVTTGICKRLSPWLRRRSPPIFRPDRLPIATETEGLSTSPWKTKLTVEAAKALIALTGQII